MANSSNGYKTITFRLYAPEAQNVSVAGTFNEWDVTSHPMERSQKGKNGYDLLAHTHASSTGNISVSFSCGWPVVERPCIEPVYAKRVWIP